MLSGFTLRQLEYFVAIADNKTVAAAAETLFVSPSALSLALGALETTLGVKLLIRQRSRGTTLTPMGEELVVEARKILSASRSLESAASAIRGELSGPLNIGCFETLSPWVVPPVLEHFSRNFPQVSVGIREGSADELQDEMRSGQVDAAFVFQLEVNSELEPVQIAETRPQVLLAVNHPLAEQPEISLEQLKDEAAILLSIRPAFDLVQTMMIKAGFTPNVRWKVRNVETLRSLVGRGFGYNIVLGWPGRLDSHDGYHLVRRPIADPLPNNSLQLVYPKGSLSNAKVRALQEFALTDLPQPGQRQSVPADSHR